MQDGMKANQEENLGRALAEYAFETSQAMASKDVRQALQREVRRRAYRRWAIIGFAAAAALSAIVFGVSTHSAPTVVGSQVRTSKLGSSPTTNSTKMAGPATAGLVTHQDSEILPHSEGGRLTATSRPLLVNSKRARNSPKPEAQGDWRKGEMVLSPWYYNTALPTPARSVMVRSQVDARTAMRFGMVSAGETAPVEILFGEDGLPRAMRFISHLPIRKN